MDTTHDLTFAELRRVNVDRCVNAFRHSLDGWSLADWGVAYGGEVGEALNVIKKLNRARDGIAGNSVDTATLHRMLADELADAVIYADLLAARIDVLIDTRSFAQFRLGTLSNRLGAEDLSLSDWGMLALRLAGELHGVLADLADGLGPWMFPAPALGACVRSLDLIAVAAGIDLGAAVIAKFNATSEKLGYPQRLGAPDPALLANREA